jgi:uncharacterized membrane protein
MSNLLSTLRLRESWRAWTLCAGLLGAAAQPTHAQDSHFGWTAQAVGTFPGTDTTQMFGFNNQGQILGEAVNFNAPVPFVQVFYSAGQMTAIPSPNGFAPQPAGFNDAGQVVGNAGGQNFLFSNGTLYFPAVPGQPNAHVLGINNRGDILTDQFVYTPVNGQARGFLEPMTPLGMNDQGRMFGWAGATTGGRYVGVVDSGSSFVRLGPEGSSSTPRDINEAGVVAGVYNGAAAVFDTQGRVTELGLFGGRSSEAFAINDAGDVLGNAEFSPPSDQYPTWHTFIYRDGVAEDIHDDFVAYSHSLYSTQAFGLDELGRVLVRGWISHEGGRESRVFLWDRGHITDLNLVLESFGVSLASTGLGWPVLNDVGQIALNVHTADGLTMPMILTPVPVPEPQTVALLLAGLLVPVLLRWRALSLRTDRPSPLQASRCCAAA